MNGATTATGDGNLVFESSKDVVDTHSIVLVESCCASLVLVLVVACWGDHTQVEMLSVEMPCWADTSGGLAEIGPGSSGAFELIDGEKGFSRGENIGKSGGRDIGICDSPPSVVDIHSELSTSRVRDGQNDEVAAWELDAISNLESRGSSIDSIGSGFGSPIPSSVRDTGNTGPWSNVESASGSSELADTSNSVACELISAVAEFGVVATVHQAVDPHGDETDFSVGGPVASPQFP